MQKKKISDRISYTISDKELRVVIVGHKEKMKELLLSIWLVAWAACILFICREIIGNPSGDEQLYFSLLSLFMIYFEYRMFKILLWRKHGKELILIDEDKVLVKRDIKSYGKAKEYLLHNIKELDVINKEEKGFGAELESSFWVIGGARIGFVYLGKDVGLGLKLEKNEAIELVKTMKKFMTKVKTGNSKKTE